MAQDAKLKLRLKHYRTLGPYRLQARDKEIVRLLASGYSAREIGEMGDISFRTVESIINTLCKVYGCKNRVQLAVRFTKEGWI